MTKLCPRGKAAAKRKFKVYPSAYANAYASKICAGKAKDPSGVKRKDWGPKKMNKGGGADFETSKTRIKPYGKTSKVKIKKIKPSPFAKTKKFYGPDGKVMAEGPLEGAKKGKMMIMIAIGKPKPKKANKGAIMNVANKLEKASKAHAGQAKTLKSLKLSRGGGAAIKGTNFTGVF